MSSALLGRWRLLVVVLCCLIPLTAAAAPAPHTSPQTATEIVPGYVIAQFRETAHALAKARILAQYPPLRETAGIYRLAVIPGSETQVADALAQEPAIEFASPDQRLSLPPSVLNWAQRQTRQPLRQPADAAEVAPAEGAAQATPTPAPSGPAITRLWLSDNSYGNPPRGRAEDAGKCGPRFNAPKPIWANVEYVNMPSQYMRVEIEELGFLNRTPASTGAGWGTTINASNSASQTLNLNLLKPGCYQARVVISAGTTPLPVRFQIVTAPLQDTFFPNDLWHLDQTRAYVGSGVADIKATGAWNITTGDNTVVALISSGVQTTHPEFAERLVPGWNTYDNTSNTNDDYGYGTFLAGFINAAARNDRTGAGGLCGDPCDNVGVNWGARIMPLKVTRMENTPQGYLPSAPKLSTIVEAIAFAYNSGAKIILVSFPIAPNTTEPTTQNALRNVITTATSRGVLVIAPVGDHYYVNYPPETRFFPAALPGDMVLAVTATDDQDRHWPEAMAGDYVDLAAPGWEYLTGTNIPGSPWNPQNIIDPAATSGDTAVAAAQVAGVAALVWSVNPSLTPAEVQQILIHTADKVDSETHSYPNGRNDWLGYGRVNAEAALWATRHNMEGAFRVMYEGGLNEIRRTTAGQACVRVHNTRTGAITWVPTLSTTDSDWVRVSETRSAQYTPRDRDYQGDLPSWTEVCFSLGPGPNQRTYGDYTARIIARSLMPDPQTPTVEIPIHVWYVREFYRSFLPFLENRQPWRGDP